MEATRVLQCFKGNEQMPGKDIVLGNERMSEEETVIRRKILTVKKEKGTTAPEVMTLSRWTNEKGKVMNRRKIASY